MSEFLSDEDGARRREASNDILDYAYRRLGLVEHSDAAHDVSRDGGTVRVEGAIEDWQFSAAIEAGLCLAAAFMMNTLAPRDARDAHELSEAAGQTARRAAGGAGRHETRANSEELI